jgi:uncharacterized protein YodC (DUF2158 family)
MANAFKNGDVVQLKSGGPAMTVNASPGEASASGSPRVNYQCVWFKGASKDQAVFDEHLLQSYIAPKK